MLCLSWYYHFWGGMFRYFVDFVSIWVYQFSCNCAKILDLGDDHHRDDGPFLFHRTRGYVISTCLITCDVTVITWSRGVSSRFLRSESLGLAYTQGVGIKLPLLEGGILKNLWTHDKITIVINKYLGGGTLRLCKYSIFLKLSINQWILPAEIIAVAF